MAICENSQWQCNWKTELSYNDGSSRHSAFVQHNDFRTLALLLGRNDSVLFEAIFVGKLRIVQCNFKALYSEDLARKST